MAVLFVVSMTSDRLSNSLFCRVWGLTSLSDAIALAFRPLSLGASYTGMFMACSVPVLGAAKGRNLVFRKNRAGGGNGFRAGSGGGKSAGSEFFTAGKPVCERADRDSLWRCEIPTAGGSIRRWPGRGWQ